jgi:amino acid transporter
MPYPKLFAANLTSHFSMNAAAKGECDEELNLTPEMRNFYKRSAKQYPYRSHLQWVRAVYGLLGCSLLAIFQGWRTFAPMNVRDFLASYLPVCSALIVSPTFLTNANVTQLVLFTVISLAYFFKTRGFAPHYWRVRASHLNGLESVGPVVVEASTSPCKTCGAKHRRGYLVLPSKSFFAIGNMKAISEWIWVWLK